MHDKNKVVTIILFFITEYTKRLIKLFATENRIQNVLLCISECILSFVMPRRGLSLQAMTQEQLKDMRDRVMVLRRFL